MTSEQIRQKRQKARRGVSSFASLLAAPADGSLTLPLGGRFVIEATQVIAAGTLALTVVIADKTLSIRTEGMVSGDQQYVDWLEADAQLTLEPGFLLKLDTGLGVYQTVLT